MKKFLIALSIISGFLGIGIYKVNFSGIVSPSLLPVSEIAPLSAELEAKTETWILTPGAEYKSVIDTYNAKIAEIRKYCNLDKRCGKNGGLYFYPINKETILAETW